MASLSIMFFLDKISSCLTTPNSQLKLKTKIAKHFCCCWIFSFAWIPRIPLDFYTLQVEALERLVSLSKPIRARVLLALREATKDPPDRLWEVGNDMS